MDNPYHYLDLGATFLFSVTGAMVAIRRHYDWVGLFVLALCSGIGGGLLRDGVFIQEGPPAAMRSSGYLWAVIAGCVTAGLFHQGAGKLEGLFLYADALGLGAYGVVGMSKAQAAGLSLPASIFVGVANAVGGSVIRDVLVRSEPLLFKPGQFYVLASLVGVCAHSVLERWVRPPPAVADWIAISITFLIRVLSIVFNWKTGPILPEPAPPPPADVPGPDGTPPPAH
ncbi:MAG: TRIC cation channel family protein [Verrucomicrobiota bacterium]